MMKVDRTKLDVVNLHEDVESSGQADPLISREHLRMNKRMAGRRKEWDNLENLSGSPADGRISAALKRGLLLLTLIWMPVMIRGYGVENLLWLCEIGNILLVIAIWKENALLVSALFTGLLMVDLAWTLDLIAALITGIHPFGATRNMFDAQLPLLVRLGSLFHVAVPVVLLFAIRRLGFDRRGVLLQSLMTTVVLWVSFVWAPPSANINWVWGPGFGPPQTVVPPVVYLLVCMVGYPVLLYLPVHVIALYLTRPPMARDRPRS